MNRILLILLALAPLAAGCINPEALDRADAAIAPAPPADERITGMTMEETKVDSIVPCDDNGSALLPRESACAERILEARGRIGETSLPIELDSVNGAIVITAGPGDAWSFLAKVRVEAADEEGARKALDEAWAWSHEEGGRHQIKAGPVESVPSVTSLLAVTPRVRSAAYQLVLPEWVVLDVKADTSNGAITIGHFRATALVAHTSNGAITVAGVARNVDLDTSNGAITATLAPDSEGAWRASTSNGAITLEVEEGRSLGYDVDATTSNGRITILLDDGDLTTDERNHKHFTTEDFASRAHRATVTLETSNGAITVT